MPAQAQDPHNKVLIDSAGNLAISDWKVSAAEWGGKGWSVALRTLHGGRQEGVQVIEESWEKDGRVQKAKIENKVLKKTSELEVIGDTYTLQPDPFELVTAARELVKLGFEVFPYCTDDLVSCYRLLDAGCRILMPWGAPIGSGLGLVNPNALRTLRERITDVPLIVDAGIGSPADAAQAMEMGFDGVLLNSAVAHAQDPVLMAEAFKLAIDGGRKAYLAGIMAEQDMAVATTPVTGRPFVL